MNKILIVFLSIAYFSVSAQYKSVEPDNRLKEIYPQEKLDYLVASSPNEVAFLNFKLDHSYELVKDADFIYKDEVLKEIEISDVNDFNFLSLGIIPLTNKQLYYKVINSEYIMMVRSLEQVKSLFKQKYYNK